MKLKEWALLAEIVGAVAVVISLTFVGVQARQSAEQTASKGKALALNHLNNREISVILLY
jgi:hypothetical protein